MTHPANKQNTMFIPNLIFFKNSTNLLGTVSIALCNRFFPLLFHVLNSALFNRSRCPQLTIFVVCSSISGDSLRFTWTNTGFFGIGLRNARFQALILLRPAFILQYLCVQCETWWATAFPFRSTFNSCCRARIHFLSAEIPLIYSLVFPLLA